MFDLGFAQAPLLALTAVGTAVWTLGRRRAVPGLMRVVVVAMAVYALAQIGIALALFVNHAPAPFNLEAMESTVLEHVRRLMSGRVLYADPTPQFGALAYNPLYYFVSIPFVWVFGSNLLALRLSAIAATLAAGVMVFVIVRRHSGSRWWALIAVGLFAAAYRVMDCYLDTAHADGWMLFATLLGCDLIDRQGEGRRDMAGSVILVAAFWFKQHAALFTLGAVAYLIRREGWRRAWPALAVVAVLGLGLYCIAPAWLGPRFHYFTWQVPRRWMSLDLGALVRLAGVLGVAYPALAALSLGGMVAAVRSRRLHIWYALVPVALATGLLGVMDGGSLDNVFIPLGVWLIVTGTIALKEFVDRFAAAERWGVHVAVLGISWTLLAYNPGALIVAPSAARSCRELVTFVHSLHGPVYAPMFGPLPAGNPFQPTLHAVALEDMIRAPGFDERDHPLARRLLEPVLHPAGTAYLLVDAPIDQDPLLGFLARAYVLETDLGERFADLAELPRRIEIGGPRYLYRTHSARESGRGDERPITRDRLDPSGGAPDPNPETAREPR